MNQKKRGGYHVYCPSLKGSHSFGDTIDKALENIKEAIELYLEPDEIDLDSPDKQIYEIAV